MADATAKSTPTQALTGEILASEFLRVRVLIIVFTVTTLLQIFFLSLYGEQIAAIAGRPVPWWIPLAVISPFLVYETGVAFLLRHFARKGRDMPTMGRFGNALVETSLPTIAILVVHHFTGPGPAFGSWPPLLYFIFIIAATLRLDFVLPVFTGLVAAIEYMAVAAHLVQMQMGSGDPTLSPLYHGSKSALMIAGGIVSGLVALRLRAKLMRVIEEAAERERVTSLFGQHVSPAVVNDLLHRTTEAEGETREVCVLFLDIRDFTANARVHRPAEVVAFLNSHFAFMIEAVDRNHGIVNKFLGDGFMAVFGAPLDDPAATSHAVTCAREILAEIDRRGLSSGAWPLRIGIGIHAGLAVTGNVGSPRRKEFTVIGDAVNLASRLEQLNKEYGSRLLVSDAVARAAAPVLGEAESLGEVNVKGYTEPVRVWRLDP